MSDPFRNTEEASDARFNVPFPGGFGEGSTPPPGAFEAPNPKTYAPFIRDAQEPTVLVPGELAAAFKGSELSFSFPYSGGVFTRLARATLSDFEGVELIDLRTLRAHLEEASFLVANAIVLHERQR